MLMCAGFRYYESNYSVKTLTRSWRCVKYRFGCRATCKTQEDQMTIMPGDHDHAPDPAENEAVSLYHEMKVRAVVTQETPSQINMMVTNGITLETSLALPSYKNRQRTVERIRRRYDAPYPVPSCLAEIDVPEALRITTRNENFLLYDSGANDRYRILIFGTRANVECLKNNENWFVDGTFSVAPNIFTQLFTIHALINNKVVPLIYVLMPSKREDIYFKNFSQLKEIESGLNPGSIMMDYEKAVINAARRSFVSVDIKGCLFHLNQSIWRKIQSEAQGVIQYNEDENVRMALKCLMALSFVPECDVVASYRLLQGEVGVENDLINVVFDYFEDVYIGRMRGEATRAPQFPIAMWNVYERMSSGLPSTNNSVEGWHRAFQILVGAKHPSLYCMIEKLRSEQDLNEQILARIAAGHIIPPFSKRKYELLNTNIRKVMLEYTTRERIDYLKGIASNIHY